MICRRRAAKIRSERSQLKSAAEKTEVECLNGFAYFAPGRSRHVSDPDLLVAAPREGEGGVLHLLSGRTDPNADGTRQPRRVLGSDLYEIPDCDGDGVLEIGAGYRYEQLNDRRVRVFSGSSLEALGDFAFHRLR